MATQQGEIKTSLTSLIQKYNLDISIISVSEIEGLTRIEAEFYDPIFLEKKKQLENKAFITLGEVANVYSGPAYSSEEINEIGGDNFLPIVKIGDVTNKRNIEQLDFVSKNEVEKFSNKFYHKDDILISMTGDPWNVGGAHMFEVKNNESIVYNQRVACIRKKKNDIPLYYLFSFLDSEYSRFHIERWAMGIRQRNASINDIRTIAIPLPSPTFQSSIAELIREDHKQRELSKSLYAEAEHILLSELGLVDWQPSEENITEKMSAEVELFGRCDAEFFQPKYDEMIKICTGWKTKKLDDLFDVFSGKSYKYTGGNDLIKVIKTKNLRLDEVDLEGVEDFISNEERDKTKVQFVQKGDVLFASMGVGSLGRSNIYLRDETNCVVDSTVKILREKSKGVNCRAEVLNVFFQLPFTQELIYRYIVGSSGIINFYDTDLKNLPIPILPDSIQSLISEKITASHRARETSKKLLGKAKRAVEIFIEDDEGGAKKYLD